MERGTFRLHFIFAAAMALTGLTACNPTDFAVSPEGQKELDKLNPVEPPVKPSPTATPVNPQPSPTIPPVVVPSPSPTPTVVVTPVPSPTPTVTATPTPTVTPSPTPVVRIVDGSNEFSPPKVETRPMVDILFVVDNSGSMDDDQKILASSFGDFIKAFKAKDVDAHYGVITTDMTSASATVTVNNVKKPYWTERLPGFINPSTGNLLSKFLDAKWLRHSDSDLENRFKVNSKVGIVGSGSEQGLQSLELAIGAAKLSGFNEGFIRDEAMLSVVIVSDEDNDITEKNLTPDALIARVSERIAMLKGPKSRGYSCDIVAQINAAKPASIAYPLTASVNPYPNVYLKAADKLGCRKIDISTNWGGDLAKIGYDIVNQAEKEFKLSAKPVDGSLVVKINGVVIAADAKNGYVFHADRNTIELVGDALASSAGGKVTATYKYIK